MAKAKLRSHDIVFKDKHMTKQDHGGLADINSVAQMYFDGRLEYPDTPPAVYGQQDPEMVERNMLLYADLQTHHEELPSDARDRWQSPQAYLEFLDANQTEIAERGLQAVIEATLEQPEFTNPETKPAQNAPENGATDAEPGTEEPS